MKPIDKLIQHFGNISAAARGVGAKNRQVVQGWAKNGRIPYKWGVPVEKKTGGAITASEIYQAASKADR